MKKIKIKSGDVEVEAILNDTKTAESIWNKLPITGRVNTWGDEIYFSIPVKIEAENPKAVVDLGDLGYWREGSAFCIFFGETPVSCKGEIRPASAVNIFGKVDLNRINEFKKIKDGDKIEVLKVE
jgi:hypothetical protein